LTDTSQLENIVNLILSLKNKFVLKFWTPFVQVEPSLITDVVFTSASILYGPASQFTEYALKQIQSSYHVCRTTSFAWNIFAILQGVGVHVTIVFSIAPRGKIWGYQVW
jgi:hypothetical protein